VNSSGLSAVDWTRWTVIYLKPDAVSRQLTDQILERISGVMTVCAVTAVTVTREQIFAHYADLFPRAREIGADIDAELCRLHVGRQAVLALGHGARAAPRLRELIGPTDPAAAGPGTIRGRYGTDTLTAGRADRRLIENLIHTSDDQTAACRDFINWYGPARASLLTPTATARTDRSPS
jgi:nucleoside-diphosphate kinase